MLIYFVFYAQNTPYTFVTNLTSNSAYIFIYFISPFITTLYFIKINYNDLLQTVNNSPNFALTNILAFYHPLLLFISIKFFHKTLKKFNTSVYYSKQNNYIVITILLGSWWSSQELLWGGFWNWDFVEVTLMYLLFNSVTYSHIKNFIVKYNMYLKNFYITLALYIIVNRTPIISSQHSFATSLFFKYNVMYAIALLFIFVVTVIIIAPLILKKINSYYNTLKFILIFLLLASLSKQIFNINYTLPSVLKLFLKILIIIYILQTKLWLYIINPFMFLTIVYNFIFIYYKQPQVKIKKKLHNFYMIALLFVILFFLSKNCKIQRNNANTIVFFFKKTEFFTQNSNQNYNIFYKKCVKFIVNFKTNALCNIQYFRSFILNYDQPQKYYINLGFAVAYYYYFSKLIRYLKLKLVNVFVSE